MAALSRTARSCVAHVQGGRIVAMSITAPAHYAVLLDKSGQPLHPVLLGSDRRPAQVAAELAQRYGQELFDATWCHLSRGWTLSQLAWLSRTEPSVWSRVHRVLIAKDYVRQCLTGNAATDPSDAAGTAMWDQRTRRWIPSLLEDLGLPRDAFPDVLPSTASGGGLTRQWSARLGLASGLPVIVGATDTAAELVSIGATRAGTGLVKVATTGTVVAVTASPRPDPSLLTYPHPRLGHWYSLAVVDAAASAYEWIAGIVGLKAAKGRDLDIVALNRLARAVPAGSEGVLFLPFLEGERSPSWDPNMQAAFVGLTAAHRSGHLVRATLEGISLALRVCRDHMRGLGIDLQEAPFLTGGGLRDPLWRSITVSALDAPGRYARLQGPALGAARIAAAACTGDDQLEHVPGPPGRTHQVAPNPIWAKVYGDRLGAFRHAIQSERERESTPLEE
jgi:xylulokinase